MRMKKIYAGVASGDTIRQKETPARPWEQPEKGKYTNGAHESPDEHLSDLGIFLRDKLQALMTYMRGNNGNGKHE